MITSPRIAIIGAGMSGLCMAMKLQDAGIESYTVYELASDVGGTWRDNTYPGLSCDVPSRFYSYSFQPNPSWTHTFSSGAEIQGYFQRICDERGIRPHIRFNTAVESACYQDGRWRLRTRSGDRTDPVISDVIADVVVTATGVLRIPRYPDIAGLDSFTGPMFHSARWDHSVSLSDKRIGLIGTGSSGVQIITELAGKVRGLTVFQRTAQWVLPMPNRRYSRLIRSILERFPRLNVVYYRLWQTFFERMFGRAVVEPGWRRRMVDAWCRWNLSRVRDPELRRRLTPDYRPMCKRLVMSAGYYRAMQKPGVHLVTEPIDHVEPTGIVTADGRRHELDMIVLATGFEFHAYVRPLELRGENGLTLDEAWADGPRAYRTVAMPGFPNLFMLMGPHSPVGNQSLVLVAESQADYALWWIDQLRRGRIASAAPTVDATARFNADMKAAMPQTIWVTGCRSWYLGRDGLPELFPWRPERHRELLAEPVLADFDVST
jgi:cation diffusion facilitator CzcD-associated flavoprotein CzcO